MTIIRCKGLLPSFNHRTSEQQLQHSLEKRGRQTNLEQTITSSTHTALSPYDTRKSTYSLEPATLCKAENKIPERIFFFGPVGKCGDKAD